MIYPASVARASGTLVAVGARAEGENAVEVACEVGVPPADAGAHVAALRKRLGPGARTAVGAPMREIGTLAEATSGEPAGGTWVRAAVRLNRPVGFFTNELVRGTCRATSAAERSRRWRPSPSPERSRRGAP